MKVELIRRGKITHVGFKGNIEGKIQTFSACNKRSDVTDKVLIGESSEITCKRCLKILSRADENGCVRL